MFASIRKFLSEVAGGAKDPGRFEHNDYRLAAAALLMHAAAIDGDISDVERKKLHGKAGLALGLGALTAIVLGVLVALGVI